MRRATLDAFGDEPFDVLVIGGGIYGLMAARDAALRGLRTALVERDDFGGATSHNSLKLMHGGIRYVQHLDFARLRASARERAFWQRAAAPICTPLEFTIPLFGHGIRGPEAFGAAAAIYTLASRGLRGPHYNGARAVGAKAARQRLGGFAPEGLSGGGVWRDGQLRDVNRLHMACLRAAIEAGALAANYMDASALISANGRVTGARLRDRLTGAEGQLRARVTLSCAGQAAAALARPHLRDPAVFSGFLRATNLVVDREVGRRGFAVVSRSRSDAVVDRGGRMYFLTPWQGRTIIGTHESSLDHSADSDVDDFLSELALACPQLGLGRKDVLWVHRGVIPANIDDSRGGGKRHTRGSLLDHSGQGLGGLISVAGVKYTTARLIAERAVDAALLQLGTGALPSTSFETPLPVDDSADPDPHSSDAGTLAQRLRRAADQEMATSLSDVTVRRTLWAETGLLNTPGVSEKLAAAAAMANLPA
ncbi:FAD-dependent oxidoreductase [Salipiger sp. 1_MG-2023]|uniref:FAD-dependent oxidoreductase n=1 Tax=Salipiger sp. 1_MG-2023 TaxID=3062665 RepID=UPI0026E42619|nr:FAD-dependent oxidoreductase [Salipiger sp. 1_MG-2023]MDO6587045.1 FAD-dependent oxidoreductase [Salipiger sp. 1_MG-2023]